jgi:DNA replication protein DnaC
LLRAYGYPEDYTDVHYECEKCGDTGYVDTKMCECMKRSLVLAGYESSGLGELIKTQSFDNFSLDWYKNNAEFYSKMNMNFNKIKNYAENFSKDTYYNMLFMGTTGIGKTHLSTAVAKCVIDRHFDVLYVTATGMMGDFEQKRFGNSAIDGDAGETDRYYSADLLIIDDLGTEIANQFTATCLYDVINTRIMKRKSTIISTNLKTDEIRKRYWDRITSRIFGEYQPVSFVGTDIRQQRVVLGKKN